MTDFQIKHRFSGEVLFQCKLTVKIAKEPFAVQLGFSVRKAIKAKADLSFANLSSANLRSADLSSADLSSADLRFADLRSADLRFADLRSANLRSADLRFADLSFADLRFADLRFADLRFADLRFADLRFADLRSADLRSADLRSANLREGLKLVGKLPHVRIDDGGCAENTTGTQKIPPETPKLEGYLWAYKSKTGVFQAIKCGYGAALDREELDPGDVRIDLSKIIIPPEAIEIIAPPAPKKRVKGWLNLYPGNGKSILYNTRGMADQEATNSRTTRSACIEIDVEEGEGLS